MDRDNTLCVLIIHNTKRKKSSERGESGLHEECMGGVDGITTGVCTMLHKGSKWQTVGVAIIVLLVDMAKYMPKCLHLHCG